MFYAKMHNISRCARLSYSFYKFVVSIETFFLSNYYSDQAIINITMRSYGSMSDKLLLNVRQVALSPHYQVSERPLLFLEQCMD